jgi:hypothetical protein
MLRNLKIKFQKKKNLSGWSRTVPYSLKDVTLLIVPFHSCFAKALSNLTIEILLRGLKKRLEQIFNKIPRLIMETVLVSKTY